MKTEQPLLDILTRTLQALPDVIVDVDRQQEDILDNGRGSGIDANLCITVKGQPVRLLIKTRQSGYPRDIREAVHQLSVAQAALRSGISSGISTVSMIVAPLLSETSREYLRQNRVGYCEAGGSLYLETPWAFFSVEKPPAPRPARRVRNLYRGSSAQVLHVLLAMPRQEWHVGVLAEEAHVSLSTVHQVLTVLEEEAFVERRGKGPEVVRMLTEPGKLLDAWAKMHTLQDFKAHGFYGWAKSSSELRNTVAEAFGDAGFEYALTLASGAELVAPFATAVDRLSFIVPADASLEQMASVAKLDSAQDGVNITLFVTNGLAPFLFRRKIKGVWVASDIQLYLDLMASPARGKEQAKHLRQERLSF